MAAEKRPAEHGTPGPREARPVRRSAEEARQGRIILGPYGRWIWIGAFAVLILLVLFGL